VRQARASSIAIPPIVFGAVDVAAGLILFLPNLTAFAGPHDAVGFGLVDFALDVALFFGQTANFAFGQFVGTNALPDALLLFVLAFAGDGQFVVAVRKRGDGQAQ
jgi:hypothetical protein